MTEINHVPAPNPRPPAAEVAIYNKEKPSAIPENNCRIQDKETRDVQYSLAHQTCSVSPVPEQVLGPGQAGEVAGTAGEVADTAGEEAVQSVHKPHAAASHFHTHKAAAVLAKVVEQLYTLQVLNQGTKESDLEQGQE